MPGLDNTHLVSTTQLLVISDSALVSHHMYMQSRNAHHVLLTETADGILTEAADGIMTEAADGMILMAFVKMLVYREGVQGVPEQAENSTRGSCPDLPALATCYKRLTRALPQNLKQH